MTEIYRAASYAPDRVAKRYIRKLLEPGPEVFRVFECAAPRPIKTRYRDLPGIGAGPTLREYDTDGAEVPRGVLKAARKRAGQVIPDAVEWPLNSG